MKKIIKSAVIGGVIGTVLWFLVVSIASAAIVATPTPPIDYDWTEHTEVENVQDRGVTVTAMVEVLPVTHPVRVVREEKTLIEELTRIIVELQKVLARMQI